MPNAIILAAGKSNRFAPFTYEKPKGLFCVKGQALIDRQIEQLHEAGITEIAVVVGFMKEKFFYLEQKYGVKLLVNNTFAHKGNLYSLYVARQFLGDTFVCNADHYHVNNPFLRPANHSYRACAYKEGPYDEFGVTISDVGVITDTWVGGRDSYAMVGHAYFSQSFSQKFVELMEKEIDVFGVGNLFWEEFYGRHQRELSLWAEVFDDKDILEFDSVEDLRQFDSDFFNNVDSDILKNICSVLGCEPNDIGEIEVIQKGLTNVSFKFTYNNIEYVYRHPGGTAGNLVDRVTEHYTQYKAKEIGIDSSFIHMDPSGWKLSYFVQDLTTCDLDGNDEQLAKAMDFLRQLHSLPYQQHSGLKIFDTYAEAIKLMQIASATKGNLADEFADLVSKAGKLDGFLKGDGYRQEALCHNDTYAPNYLVTNSMDMYLIDWEYAGINDRANDIACICCRYDFADEQIERYLRAYFGRPLTEPEHKHYIGAIALCAFYWFCWGLYKGSVNDDDGFFFLPAYRNCQRFMDVALESYEVK